MTADYGPRRREGAERVLVSLAASAMRLSATNDTAVYAG